MEISDIFLILIFIVLTIIGVVIYVNFQQIKLLMAQQMLEPKSSPKIKSKQLRYNPSDLLNPYKYEPEDDLDPVVPHSK